MLDLPHDFPDHVVVRLPRRRLKFAVDPESHVAPLLLPFCRMRPLAPGALAYPIRDRPARHAALEFRVPCDQTSLRLLSPRAGGHESRAHSIPKSRADLQPEHSLQIFSWSEGARASAPGGRHRPAPLGGPMKPKRRRSPSFRVLRFRNPQL